MSNDIPKPQPHFQADSKSEEVKNSETKISQQEQDEQFSVEKIIDILGVDFELFSAKDKWKDFETAEGKCFTNPKLALRYLCFKLFIAKSSFRNITTIMNYSQLGSKQDDRYYWQRLSKGERQKLILTSQEKFRRSRHEGQTLRKTAVHS